MTCILSCSHGIVIATAMVFSSTALFLAISRQFSGNHQTSDLQDQQIIRPCLCSEEKKKQGRKKKNKKVKFAENVKEPKGNGEEYRKKRERLPEPMIKPDKTGSVCRNDMPPNRIALYNGILRDRNHRVQCSY